MEVILTVTRTFDCGSNSGLIGRIVATKLCKYEYNGLTAFSVLFYSVSANNCNKEAVTDSLVSRSPAIWGYTVHVLYF